MNISLNTIGIARHPIIGFATQVAKCFVIDVDVISGLHFS